jgi:hypothetical protein
MLAAEFHRTENLPVSPPSSTVTGLIGGARANVVPTLIAASGERASLRFLEFLAANIRNPLTRRAYSRHRHGVYDLARRQRSDINRSRPVMQPLRVSAWIKRLVGEGPGDAD